jgi:hypothetical protein
MNSNEQNMESKEQSNKSSEVWALDMIGDMIIYVGNVVDSSKLRSFNITSNYSSSERIELTDVIGLNANEVKKIMSNAGSTLLTVLNDCYIMKDCYTARGSLHLGTDEKPMIIQMNQIIMPHYLPNTYRTKDKKSDLPNIGIKHG